MPIRFRCSRCDHAMESPTATAGASVKCGRCLEDLVVPTPKRLQTPSERAPATIRVRCRHCKFMNEGPATAAGRTARCVGCGEAFVVPGGPPRTSPVPPSRLAPDIFELEEGEPVEEPRPPTRYVGAGMRPRGAIAGRSAWWDGSRDLNVDFGTAWLAAICSVILLAPTAMILGPAILPHGLLMLVATLLLVVGGVMTLGGFFWLHATPFRESATCGVLCGFAFPIYLIYY